MISTDICIDTRPGDVLSEKDILDVLADIMRTWPRQSIEAHNQLNERALGHREAG